MSLKIKASEKGVQILKNRCPDYFLPGVLEQDANFDFFFGRTLFSILAEENQLLAWLVKFKVRAGDWIANEHA